MSNKNTNVHTLIKRYFIFIVKKHQPSSEPSASGNLFASGGFEIL